MHSPAFALVRQHRQFPVSYLPDRIERARVTFYCPCPIVRASLPDCSALRGAACIGIAGIARRSPSNMPRTFSGRIFCATSATCSRMAMPRRSANTRSGGRAGTGQSRNHHTPCGDAAGCSRHSSRHRRNLQPQGQTPDRNTCGPGNAARCCERHSLARWQGRAASRSEARRNPCDYSPVVDGNTRLR